jgi:hypothetical protein
MKYKTVKPGKKKPLPPGPIGPKQGPVTKPTPPKQPVRPLPPGLKPNMEHNPNMKYKTVKSVKNVDISNKKNKTGGSTTKSPAKGLIKQISKSKPGMNYKPVTRRGGK